MTYVALLRGINVGGNHKIEMPRLKRAFEKLGLKDVKTYINSGNVIFSAPEENEAKLCKNIETVIEKEFGFQVPTLLRNLGEIEKVLARISPTWVNDVTMRCDVMFLWQAIDSPEILKRIPSDPKNEDLIYAPGAVIWRIDRDKVRRGAVPKIIGSAAYKQMTIRNVNTVRRLYELMRA